DLLGLLRPRLRGRWLEVLGFERGDRKSTRLNSSHPSISYAVFCLKKRNPLVSAGWHIFTICTMARTSLAEMLCRILLVARFLFFFNGTWNPPAFTLPPH